MSVNKATLLGRVGKDPELKSVGDTKCAQFSLATTERGFTRKDGTKVEEKTEWHNLVIWGRKAEIAGQYVHKGDLLFVEGRIQYRSWDDNNGGKHYITEILVDTLELMPKNQSQQGTEPPLWEPMRPNPAPQPQQNMPNEPQDDDALPF